MNTLTLLSPAKINLFLKVLKKRPDGYHELVTLFERIDLCDTLTFRLRRDGKIRIVCRHKDVPSGPRNLAYRVALLLKNEFAVKDGVTIAIRKRIPVAAGLAGGSSNAATTFLGLNKLWNLSLSRKKLMTYAKTIGADVPFFLADCSWAVGTERGDRIKPLILKTKLWHVLVTPDFKLKTPDVFRNLARVKPPKGLKHNILRSSDFKQERKPLGPTNMLTKQRSNVNILIRHLRKNDVVRVGEGLYNDLEMSAFSLAPRLKRLKKVLEQFSTIGVSLSGSGPSLFGLTRSQKAAAQIRRSLAKHHKQVFAVTTY